MGTRKQKKEPDKNILRQSYLEIYIEENGRMILTPFTSEALPILKAVSDNSKCPSSTYCG